MLATRKVTATAACPGRERQSRQPRRHGSPARAAFEEAKPRRERTRDRDGDYEGDETREQEQKRAGRARPCERVGIRLAARERDDDCEQSAEGRHVDRRDGTPAQRKRGRAQAQKNDERCDGRDSRGGRDPSAAERRVPEDRDRR